MPHTADPVAALQRVVFRPEVAEIRHGLQLVKEYLTHGTVESRDDFVFPHRGATGPGVDAIRTAHTLQGPVAAGNRS